MYNLIFICNDIFFLNENIFRVIVSVFIWKIGLTLIPKSLWAFDMCMLWKYWVFDSLLSLTTKFRCFLYLVISSSCFVLFALIFSSEHLKISLQRFLSMRGFGLSRKNLVSFGAWAFKTFPNVFFKVCVFLRKIVKVTF